MSAIDEIFAKLRSADRKAFVPFITAGDPDLQFTSDALRILEASGAAICEVGVPYSDPIADGPVIQASYTRALQNGFQVKSLWDMFERLQSPNPSAHVMMVSYSIIHRVGTEAFVRRSVQSGVAGLIVPDLPMEEAGTMAGLCEDSNMSLIQLITPTTRADRAASIVQLSQGFIYCVSVTGVTGERTTMPVDLVERIRWIRSQTSTPICVGFGVSTPEQVRQVAPLADGVIVGSAFVRRIATTGERPRDSVLDELGHFTRTMVDALSFG